MMGDMLRRLILQLFGVGGLSHATNYLIESPHFHIIYDQENLSAFAQEVAQQAEEAILVLEALFHMKVERFNLVLQDDSDDYNAFAIAPMPRSACAHSSQ
ncbi:MAG: hypothetical protein R2865_09395 [Deinococcales bacterium]